MTEMVASMQNSLLSEAVVRSFLATGVFRLEWFLPGKTGDALSICQAVQADVLLMEVRRLAAYTLESRLGLIKRVRKTVSNCKFLLLCDENSDAELAHRVVLAREDRLIAAFLYASVTPAYLIAALDAI